MPTTRPKTVAKSTNPCTLAITRTINAHRQCARGALFYVLSLAFICFFLAFNFESTKRVYVTGQVAESDVVADRFLLVEDSNATEARRKQVVLLQPPVYDFSMEPYILFEQRLIGLMREFNGAPPKEGVPPPSVQFANDIGQELAQEILPQFGLLSTQSFVLKKLLPLLRERLAEGMIGELRAARVGRSGVIIRNLDTGTEMLRPDVTVLPDVQSFLTEISTLARKDRALSHNARRAINIILAASMPPTLTLNQEATQRRASDVAGKIEPVYYQIQKGELIARRGDLITREQQLKIQALYHTSAMPLNVELAAGSFLICLFISIGFFLSPSGKPASVIHSKDLALMAVVAMLTAVSARGVHGLGSLAASSSLADAFSIAFPVAGAVGFVATIFSARRYVTLGLLLTLLTTIALDLSFYFALFHFLSSMLATWLVSTAVSRQDAVWNIFPIILGEMLLIAGVVLVEPISIMELPMLMTAVCINAVMMLILFFSLSPVLETLFGYSTRFRLMEYINLEQPLMQEIMVTIPGTYHHSLVVANMVEAGAKAIGANSLLCKVAALYHDCGKLVYPQYFVENQFGAPNKHDKLSPSMSALIIISHVKKGVEICQRYGLGQEIIDIVAQHHGSRVMRYFYQKAVNLGENPNEADYSYPGPKPQTREAAILMLADSVEASSRTLTDPTPTRLKAHIEKIIKGILSEGQLDESELTFRDLHLLAESFQRVLTGIFHHRIVYPESRRADSEQGLRVPAPNPMHPLAPGPSAIPPLPEPALATAGPAAGSADGEAEREEMPDAAGGTAAEAAGHTAADTAGDEVTDLHEPIHELGEPIAGPAADLAADPATDPAGCESSPAPSSASQAAPTAGQHTAVQHAAAHLQGAAGTGQEGQSAPEAAHRTNPYTDPHTDPRTDPADLVLLQNGVRPNVPESVPQEQQGDFCGPLPQDRGTDLHDLLPDSAAKETGTAQKKSGRGLFGRFMRRGSHDDVQA